jgi:DNA invertase Pin-like site-specific DNA recombinase
MYNPREPNDRLLLGVKGTISEAELFTLRTRLYEGRWNKARKGLLHFLLPVGYVLTADGGWALDPEHCAQRFTWMTRYCSIKIPYRLRRSDRSASCKCSNRPGY